MDILQFSRSGFRGVLTTMLPDGQPQHARQPQGEPARRRSRRHRPFMQIRGDAELVADGGLEHADRMAQKCTAHPRCHGYVYPLDVRGEGTRVICRIRARRVSLDAIHSTTGPPIGRSKVWSCTSRSYVAYGKWISVETAASRMDRTQTTQGTMWRS